MRLLTALIAVGVAAPAMAHDIYTNLYSPSGKLCCGGDWSVCPDPDQRCLQKLSI